MPNHCSNRLIVTGPAKDLREFGIHAMGPEYEEKDFGKPTGKKVRNPLDLDQFLQMPKELEGIQNGGCTIDGKSYRNWRVIKNPDGTTTNVGLSSKEEKELIAKYGATNWYDWKCANQGTKWGCYDVTFHADGKGKVVYTYQTAWSPFSEKVLLEMSRMFKKLTFRMEFAECGSGFWGFNEAKGGVMVDEGGGDAKAVGVDANGKHLPEDSDEEPSHYVYPDVPDEYIELLETSG